MAYVPTVFRNGQAPAYDSAEELNKVQQGIVDAHNIAKAPKPLNFHTISAGNVVLFTDSTLTQYRGTSFFKKKEYRIPYSGSIRINFKGYVNVNSAVGEFYVAVNGVQKSETFTTSRINSNAFLYNYVVQDLKAGDLVQIYMKISSTEMTAYVSETTLSIDEQTAIIGGEV